MEVPLVEVHAPFEDQIMALLSMPFSTNQHRKLVMIKAGFVIIFFVGRGGGLGIIKQGPNKVRITLGLWGVWLGVVLSSMRLGQGFSLEIQVCKCYLFWGLKSINITYFHLFGSPGFCRGLKNYFCGGPIVLKKGMWPSPLFGIKAKHSYDPSKANWKGC